MARFEMYPKGDGIEYNITTKESALDFIKNNYDALIGEFKRIKPLDSTTRHDIEQAYMDENKYVMGLIDSGVKLN